MSTKYPIGKRVPAHLDAIGDVEFNQNDVHHAEAQHEISWIFLSFSERAIAFDEFLAHTFERRSGSSHQAVEERVDCEAHSLRITLKGNGREYPIDDGISGDDATINRVAYPRATSIPSPEPNMGDSVSAAKAETHDTIEDLSPSLSVKKVTSVLAG